MRVFIPLFAAFLSFAAHAQEGQDPAMAAEGASGDGQDVAAAEGAPEAAISTTLTFRSHSIAGGAQANFLEGNACPAGRRMVSGACHPGFSDRMVIVNQFPNVGANTWRCGFRNNTGATRTVWIYTLCAQ